MILTGLLVVSTGNDTILRDSGRIEALQINRKSDTISVILKVMLGSKFSVRPTDFISLVRSLRNFPLSAYLLLFQGV